VEEGLGRWLVEAERGWRYACLLPIDPVGATPLLVKRPLEEFCRLRWLGPLNEVASRLLAQPALQLKSASLA
jgi:hypothetical protein